MKKKVTVLLALALVLVLSACGSSSKGDVGYWNMADNAPSVESPGDMPMEPSAPSESWSGENWDGVVDSAAGAAKPTGNLSEKIIYSSSVLVETTDFDGAMETIDGMLDRYGAFLESSSVSGRSYEAEYYGYETYRTARYKIRVPVTSFEQMRDSMADVGSVLNVETYSENITASYYDVQSRLDSYRIEQERLMDMLSKCETVSEMIEVESRLSTVRYELESCETTLRNWQNQVDYSTIDVTVNEVKEYTKVVEPHRGYWQEIGDGFKDTLKAVGNFFKDLFRHIVIALPVLAISAVAITVAVVIIVHAVKKKK